MALGHALLGRPLILRLAFGTEVPEIAPEDLSDVPIVRLGKKAEDEIADRVEQTSTLRMDADDEEDALVAKMDGFLEELLGAPSEEVDVDAVSDEDQASDDGAVIAAEA